LPTITKSVTARSSSIPQSSVAAAGGIGGRVLPGTLRETVADIEAAGGRALPYQVDLTSSESRAALVGRVVADLGPVDILVNNAGTSIFIPFTDISEKRVRLITTLNYLAPFDLCQRVIPAIRFVKGGPESADRRAR
jgi:NAD(P)-dependent dehydrogenase (short-subunit alcohol dehydrogenase family)